VWRPCSELEHYAVELQRHATLIAMQEHAAYHIFLGNYLIVCTAQRFVCVRLVVSQLWMIAAMCSGQL
jgi:hypothetical protein